MNVRYQQEALVIIGQKIGEKTEVKSYSLGAWVGRAVLEPLRKMSFRVSHRTIGLAHP